MSNDEALCDLKPLSTVKEDGYIRRSMKRNTIVICILFIIVVILCVNNYLFYKSYINVQKQVGSAYETAEVLKAEKSSLNEERENIKIENGHLKDSNSKILMQNEELSKQIQVIKQQNEELIQKNKELTDDNIALQNSLKKAAAVGVTPQSFIKFNNLSSRATLDRGTYIGKFLGTAYTPSADECGNNKGITNSGMPIIPGVSIAIDSKYWPFGTVFYIRGLGYAVAMDTGSAIKGKHRFDFAVFDKKFAKLLGQRYWEVYLIRLGNGSVDNIKL